MSIRPSVIDRTGDRPCIPNFYAVAKRMAEGREPSLLQRAVKVVRNIRSKLGK